MLTLSQQVRYVAVFNESLSIMTDMRFLGVSIAKSNVWLALWSKSYWCYANCFWELLEKRSQVVSPLIMLPVYTQQRNVTENKKKQERKDTKMAQPFL